MRKSPNVTHERIKVVQTFSSRQGAPHQHVAACLLSTGNGSNALPPIMESVPSLKNRPSGQMAVKKTEEQITKELIDDATLLSRKPDDRTARSMDRGFETVADAKRKLMQDLLLSKERIEDTIANLEFSSTPSNSGYYLDLKHSQHRTRRAIAILKSVGSTPDKSARR